MSVNAHVCIPIPAFYFRKNVNYSSRALGISGRGEEALTFCTGYLIISMVA